MQISKSKNEVIACKFNNELKSLNYEINSDGKIELIDVTHKDGMRVYKRGLIYIIAKAFQEVYNNALITVNYQLYHSMLCEIDNMKVTEEMIKKVNKRAQEIIDQDLPIVKRFMTKEEAEKFYEKEKTLKGKLQLDLKEKKEVKSKNVVIAPGRTGAKWIQELADKYNIPYLSKSIEIGVRVEVRKEVLEEICSVIYDPTIFIKTKTYNDEIRTFCTNPGGFVAKENYYGYICVNGHSLKDIKSNNSNFAFISKVNLTEPVTNTREYGESIAKIANVLGDSKPIIQTLRDLKSGRRSNFGRINKSFITPTLEDCVAGDLALVLPHRIIVNILEGLEELDKIIPGVNNDETLLYGPEIKFFSNEITTDDNFKLDNYNVYFIGDGAGKAGNIVTAAATGLVSARDIIKRTE